MADDSKEPRVHTHDLSPLTHPARARIEV
jgi:hypothetical protein